MAVPGNLSTVTDHAPMELELAPDGRSWIPPCPLFFIFFLGFPSFLFVVACLATKFTAAFGLIILLVESKMNWNCGESANKVETNLDKSTDAEVGRREREVKGKRQPSIIFHLCHATVALPAAVSADEASVRQRCDFGERQGS